MAKLWRGVCGPFPWAARLGNDIFHWSGQVNSRQCISLSGQASLLLRKYRLARCFALSHSLLEAVSSSLHGCEAMLNVYRPA